MFGIKTLLKVKQLESDLVDRDQRIELLQEQLADLRSELAKAAADSSFAVDFNRMNAYSIERIIQNGLPVTVIGHWCGPNDENVGEWNFHCNQDTHEQLVEQFRQYCQG